jgi:hypothetical protein
VLKTTGRWCNDCDNDDNDGDGGDGVRSYLHMQVCVAVLI